MGRITTRDRIWNLALKRAVYKNNPVTPEEVAEGTEASVRTARDCLAAMADQGVLEREDAGTQSRYRRPDHAPIQDGDSK